MKASIIKIGKIIGNRPIDFVFDCRGYIPALEIKNDGTFLWGGWTIKELSEMEISQSN